MNRLTIDELEMLNPDQLGKLLIDEVSRLSSTSPDIEYLNDLLRVGCPIDYKDRYGRVALHWAAIFWGSDLVMFLTTKMNNVNIADICGETALHYATERLHNIEMVKSLISKGADIHARDIHGRTALHVAAQNGHLEMVRLLLQEGAQVDARDNADSTVWDYATKEIRETLLELELK